MEQIELEPARHSVCTSLFATPHPPMGNEPAFLWPSSRASRKEVEVRCAVKQLSFRPQDGHLAQRGKSAALGNNFPFALCKGIEQRGGSPLRYETTFLSPSSRASSKAGEVRFAMTQLSFRPLQGHRAKTVQSAALRLSLPMSRHQGLDEGLG